MAGSCNNPVDEGRIYFTPSSLPPLLIERNEIVIQVQRYIMFQPKHIFPWCAYNKVHQDGLMHLSAAITA